ncbi:MAG: hypothetical protein NTY53_20885 [Kiritimatiellaeota bacterium]|nr:hypothetical protein [Kiritimatiellota bacterium]
MSELQYWSFGAALILMGRTIHYFKVTRFLKQRGIQIKQTQLSVRDWSEWAAYKEELVSDGQPLAWWYALWAIQIVLLFWIIGWFAFLSSQ